MDKLSYRKLSDNGINLTAPADDALLSKVDRYRAFIKRKAELSRSFGLDVELEEIHPVLHKTRGNDGKKSHQPPCVRWMVRGGRRGLFAAFGSGKSIMQMETLRLVIQKSRLNRPGLIVAPLGVRQEFKRDAKMIDDTDVWPTIQAVRVVKGKGGQAIGIELNRSYLLDGAKYCEAAAP